MKFNTSDATPFAVAFASLKIEELNAHAALLLTCIGIVHISRKLWLSFKKKVEEDEDPK